MIHSGVQKVKKDHRDLSFHRTFGSAAPETFADSLNLDAGLTMPDQDTDGLPFGCTGYAQADICTDEDKVPYFPKFTYDQTLHMEGIAPTDPQFEKTGCDFRDSLNSTIVYGLQAIGETPATALNHRRGAYYNVELSQSDWFDSIRSTLVMGGRSVSMATPWYPAWETTLMGLISAPKSYDTTFATWHNWVCCGWVTTNGIPYLIGKSWQGKQYGDNGFCYFPREVINQIMSIQGTGAFTVVPFTTANTQNVTLTLWSYVASYLRMILAKLS